MKRCILILGFLGCLILTASGVVAQNFTEKESLVGMKAISVVVEKLDSHAESEDLSTGQLQIDVEL